MTDIKKEIEFYPETGIVNLYAETEFCITDEMMEFLNQYLLMYRDYPDIKIANEFARRFDFDEQEARNIERNYVVFNRQRVYKRIERLFAKGFSSEDVKKQIVGDFGLDIENAEKYVCRYKMDNLDEKSGVLVKANKR